MRFCTEDRTSLAKVQVPQPFRHDLLDIRYLTIQLNGCLYGTFVGTDSVVSSQLLTCHKGRDHCPELGLSAGGVG